MPYAHEGRISRDPIEGGIGITEQQYQAALAGMLAGKIVTIDGGFAVVDPPSPDPDPEPEPGQEEFLPDISRRQFYQGLALSEFITKAEALAAMEGALPSPIQDVIDDLPDPDDQFEAAMLLKGASTFRRSHPLVAAFAAARELSETDVDDFWRFCAGLN